MEGQKEGGSGEGAEREGRKEEGRYGLHLKIYH